MQLTQLLYLLQAASTIYRFAHWHAKGPEFYSDHDMFGTMYEKVDAHVDALAEQILGLQDTVDLDNFIKMSAHYSLAGAHVERLDQSLGITKAILDQIEVCRAKGAKAGLEDLLGAIAADLETFTYFLKRRKL